MADKDDEAEDGEVGGCGVMETASRATATIKGGEYAVGTYALLLKWLLGCVVIAAEFFPALLFEVTIRARLGDEDTEGDELVDTLR